MCGCEHDPNWIMVSLPCLWHSCLLCSALFLRLIWLVWVLRFPLLCIFPKGERMEVWLFTVFCCHRHLLRRTVHLLVQNAGLLLGSTWERPCWLCLCIFTFAGEGQLLTWSWWLCCWVRAAVGRPPFSAVLLQDSCWLAQSEWSRLPSFLKGVLEVSHPAFLMINSKKYQSISSLRTNTFSGVNFCSLFKEQKQNQRKSFLCPVLVFCFRCWGRAPPPPHPQSCCSFPPPSSSSLSPELRLPTSIFPCPPPLPSFSPPYLSLFLLPSLPISPFSQLVS